MLSGKVALISGAARGIGAAIASAMTAQGACVIVGDILEEEASKLAARLGESATWVRLDVTSPADWAAAVEEGVRKFGKLSVLVNNAGIVGAPKRLDKIDHDEWNKIIAVNLTGAFNGIKASTPALRVQGGSIINISSILGLRGSEGAAAYTASKFGIRGLTKAAAFDLGKYGIRVNSVHPGTIATPMSEGVPYPTHHLPLERIGTPEEVANMVVFLASDAASYCTGAEFIADGGDSAGFMVSALTHRSG